MVTSKLFAIIAVVLFAIALILAFVSGVDKDVITKFVLGGLTALAAAHAL